MSVLLRDAEVGGKRVDVRIADGVVTHLGTGLPPSDETVDAAGGALLPGLHDHHVHLLALAAARASVAVGPEDVVGLDGLTRALREAPVRNGWVRATGYHESVAGDLDRDVLDRVMPEMPVRVQHRGGALWILNSAALHAVEAALDETPDVERDGTGRPTGRLWRYDSRLRPALPADPPDLATVGRELAALGITGVTDATPDLDDTGVELLARAHADGLLPQRVTLLGASVAAATAAGFGAGPRKLMLRDHDLPTYDVLVAMIRRARSEQRPVAVHCVTRESLILTLAVLDEVGAVAGDRIEHASVVPPEVMAWMARLGVVVVTQPDLVRSREDQYRSDVATDDLPHLYPYASLLEAGVEVCASSDAPYGTLDPWQVIATASTRSLGAHERVTAAVALDGYLRPASSPGGQARRIVPGTPADLVLLDRPLREALAASDARHVAATWIGGRLAT